MASTAEFDPVVVEPKLTLEKIKEILERGMESAKLDYKSDYDPSSTTHRVRLVKHVLAMGNTAGGYIVVGVDDDGTRKGLSPPALEKIDEATVRAQVSGFTPARIPIFVDTTLEYGGMHFAVVTVLPLRDTLAIPNSDGHCPEGPLFRKGDVLVRHGSASERWTQADADYLLRRISQAKKDDWVREFGADLRRLIVQEAGSTPPTVDATLYRLAPEDFQKLVIRLLRTPRG